MGIVWNRVWDHRGHWFRPVWVLVCWTKSVCLHRGLFPGNRWQISQGENCFKVIASQSVTINWNNFVIMTLSSYIQPRAKQTENNDFSSPGERCLLGIFLLILKHFPLRQGFTDLSWDKSFEESPCIPALEQELPSCPHDQAVSSHAMNLCSV